MRSDGVTLVSNHRDRHVIILSCVDDEVTHTPHSSARLTAVFSRTASMAGASFSRKAVEGGHGKLTGLNLNVSALEMQFRM